MMAIAFIACMFSRSSLFASALIDACPSSPCGTPPGTGQTRSAAAERANLARCKARARTRLGFHNCREVSKSHFSAVHEPGIGSTQTSLSCLMLHRARHLFIRQQTAVINSIRAHLAEFGIIAPVGRRGVEQLLEVVADPADRRLPDVARACLTALGSQLRALKAQILEFDRRIIAWHRSSTTSKRLDAIPGVGPALATALVASIADPRAFRSGRDFSAWVGLVPKQNSSGGKDKLGSISKQGDRYLRSLFTAGALAVIRYAKIHGTGHRPWLTALLARRPTKVAAIALANKLHGR